MFDFPQYERVIYKKNPLAEVLFQFRMPKLLEVEQQLPVSFQKAVRNDFPHLDTRSEQVLAFASETIEPTRIGPATTIYDFHSGDRDWKISLSSDFFSLLTTKYENWEQFKKYSSRVIDAVLSNYEPPLFTRVGLRYKSLINRKNLGIDKTAWAELISPKIGVYFQNFKGFDDEVESLLGFHSEAQFKIEGGKVTLRHGLVRIPEEQEFGYLIDADYFTVGEQEATIDAGIRTLEHLHGFAWRVFRWCIQDTLHEAMEPEPAPVSGH